MSADSTLPQSQRSLKRRLARMLLTLLIAYGLLLLAVTLLQRRMIYYPTRASLPEVENYAAEQGFKAWKNSSGEVIGWISPASGTATGAVLIVHGNGGFALHRGYFSVPIQQAAPVEVYVLEYPGYGARVGSPSAKSWRAAAEEAFTLLPKNIPKFIVGESLGTGVASHLAKTNPNDVAGMALFAPYDKLVSVGQRQMPIFPVSLLLRDRFSPADDLKYYRGPVKVVLAERDSIIPSKFGQRLYDVYAGPKTIETIEGAGHNEIADQSVDWWRRVFEFWERNRNSNSKTSGQH